MLGAMRAVVVDQGVSIGQQAGVVLLGQDLWAEPPDDLAGRLVDDPHCRDVPEAKEDPAVRERRHGVAVAPFVTGIVERDDVSLRVKVFRGVPFPDSLP